MTSSNCATARPKAERATHQHLRERDVGIESFIQPSSTRGDQDHGAVSGFTGSFKKYHYDFHVHEVALDGSVAKLTELHSRDTVRSLFRDEKKEVEEIKSRFFVPAFEFTAEEQLVLGSVFANEVGDELGPLQVLLRGDEERKEDGEEAAGAGAEKSKLPYVDLRLAVDDAAAEKDVLKDARKRGHDAVRQFFSHVLSSESSPVGAGFIRVWRKDRKDAHLAAAAAESEKTGAGAADPVTGEPPALSNRQKKKLEKGLKKGGKGKGKNDGKKGQKGTAAAAIIATSSSCTNVFRRDPWPQDRADHLLFVLYKENRDTGEAVNTIAKSMHLDQVARNLKHFGFAGTKDRRGCTTQFCTLYRTTFQNFLKLHFSPSWDRNQVFVQPIGFVDKPLELGRLRGNQFDVLVRDLKVVCVGGKGNVSKRDENAMPLLAEYLKSAFGSLEENGFLNYFGLQRFGTGQTKTHEIGALLLQGRFEDAMLALLGVPGIAVLDEREEHSPANVMEQSSGDEQNSPPTSDETPSPAPKRRKIDGSSSKMGCPTATADDADNVAAPKKDSAYLSAVREKRWRDALSLLPGRYGNKGCYIETTILEALSGGAAASSSGGKKSSAKGAGKSSKAKSEGNSAVEQKKEGAAEEVAAGAKVAKEAISDPRAVLEQLPRETLSLYYHALQSYCFNRVLATCGTTLTLLEPSVGDLVSRRPEEHGETPEQSSNDEILAGAGDVDAFLGSSEEGDEVGVGGDGEGDSKRGNYEKIPVHIVTDEDVALKSYAATDLVLPLPGFAVTYPERSGLKEKYNQVLAEFGLTVDSFASNAKRGKNQQTLRNIQLTGAYRTKIVKPTQLSWELVDTNENKINVGNRYSFLAEKAEIVSDVDALLNEKRTEKEKMSEVAAPADRDGDCDAARASKEEKEWEDMEKQKVVTPATDAMKEDAIDANKEKIALKFSCTLPTSAYLTMALRQLMQNPVERD
eukprot:g5537.t1